MKQITDIAELRQLQMGILDEIDRFCKEQGLVYFLSSGTLIGAVRHKGYSPWDDDIDIQLLRPEYNKLTVLWNENKKKHPYELISIESGNNMGYPFAKIHDPKTVTYVGNIKRTGVFVDVFPVDYVKDREDYLLRSKKIERLIAKRYACFNWMKVKHSDLPLYKKALQLLHRPLESYEKIAVNISNEAKKVKEKTAIACDMINGRYSKEMLSSEIYEDYKDVKFEDRIYRSVCDTETYLTKTYGDWRTPPPPEKQVTHHGFKAYWK